LNKRLEMPMAYEQEDYRQTMDGIIETLESLRRFEGPPGEFWPAFLEGAVRLAGATVGLLMVRGPNEEPWKSFTIWPGQGMQGARVKDLRTRVEEIAQTSADLGYAWEDGGPKTLGRRNGLVFGVRLVLEEKDRISVGVFYFETASHLPPEEIATRLKLVADIPAAYQVGRMARQARSDVVHFAEALDLMVLLNAEKRYLAAAMTLCNELASRYRSDRVSLGWLKGAYVRLQAVSHMERFEKKMDVVQSLEAAMEEAFDQDEEILWPRPEGNHAVVREHEAFSREQGSPYMVSLPVRVEDEPVGVVTCERSAEPFSEEEVRGLRVLCDQAARRLSDLKRHDRWFGARAATALREGLGKLLGVEHTFAKLLGLVACAALAFLIFGQWSYRVEAPFMLKTDDVAFLPAPFDGYIHQVHVKVGDLVDKMNPLLSLDIRELLLEESMAVANQNRYAREAEKARAQNALADMRVALALEEQARARLKMVRFNLERAEVKSPFAGIVVEGELKELLGAPVRKGDVLFKVARIDKMYSELKVDERDVHEVSQEATGEIAFVSRPDLKFPIRVERLDPVAVAGEEGNVFLLRCIFVEEPAAWWRPGMSGVAKIDAGKRNLLWILTHRTIDFIRLWLWW